MAQLSGSILLRSNVSQVLADLSGSPPLAVPLTLGFSLQGSGTAADKGDTKYTRKLTLAATPMILDLTSLTDVEGNAISFARVRSIVGFIHDQTDGHTVKFGYATTTTNAWTSLLSNPGQLTFQASTAINQASFSFVAPNTTGWVVGSSNKLVQFDPGSATIVMDLEIIGASV